MIYFNNASTTEVTVRVLDDFCFCTYKWHNPSDISQTGRFAKGIISRAQKQIASSINCTPNEIIFTSGGSESNNWAIKGYVDHYDVDIIITTEIEHASVYNSCLFCRDRGCKLIYIPVDAFGVINLSCLKDIVDQCSRDNQEVLVSIMFANNEIGTIQPIKEISKIVHDAGYKLHVDAVQAYMHTKIDVEELGIDMLSTSFHKFGGFKGSGFLYVKDGISLTPLIHGGNQFESRRSGTENVPMIFAMGNHVERINMCLEWIEKKLTYYRDKLLINIYDRCRDLCDVYINGDPSQRLCNNLSLTFKGIDAQQLIAMLEEKEIYVSAGSACSAGDNKPSRVLKAIGLSDEEAFSTIRMSMDLDCNDRMIDEFVNALVECIEMLKMM